MKRTLFLFLALICITPSASADYRHNPYTGKLDYYETTDLSAYLTSATAASTYAPITEPLSLHLDPTGQTMTGPLAGSGLAKLTAGVWGIDTNTYALNSALAGYVPTSRTLTINGTSYDLSADRSWTVTDANLSTTDVTTNNASSTKHGFLPKLENSGTKYLRDDGTWQTVSGGSGSPGGNDTNVQFNDGGAFAGEDSFTYNKTTNQLKILDGSIDVDRYTTAYTGNDDIQGFRSRINVNSTDTGAQLISGAYYEVKDTSTHTVSNWSQNWRHEGIYNYVQKSLTTNGTVYDGEDSTFGILNVIRREGTQTARSTDYFYLSQTGQYNQVNDYMAFAPSSAGEYTAVDDIGLRNEVAIVGVAADTTTVVRNAYGIWNRVTISGTYGKADNIYGNYVYVSGNANTTNQYLFYGYQSTNAGTNRYGIYSYSVDNTKLNNVLMGRTKVGFSTTAATAQVHFSAGTATAGTAPIKFTSGTLTTAAVAGQMEFLTDDYYLTISTGSARQKIVMTAGLTSGKYPIATTNGRLTDGVTPLSGTKVYYVSDTSGGAVTRKLTFTNGILTSET